MRLNLCLSLQNPFFLINLSNENVDLHLNIFFPVMYMFEFTYELDQDDLSYIWQNLAPRNYKKISKIYRDYCLREL